MEEGRAEARSKRTQREVRYAEIHHTRGREGHAYTLCGIGVCAEGLLEIKQPLGRPVLALLGVARAQNLVALPRALVCEVALVPFEVARVLKRLCVCLCVCVSLESIEMMFKTY